MIDYTQIQSRLQSGETDQQILDALQAETREVRDTRLIVWGEIRAALDPAELAQVKATIDAARQADLDVDSAWIALSSTGMRLSDPDRQAMIDALGASGGWAQETINKIKQLRVYDSRPYAELTLADVHQARLNWFAAGLIQRVSAAINLAAAADDATEETIKAAAIAEVG